MVFFLNFVIDLFATLIFRTSQNVSLLENEQVFQMIDSEESSLTTAFQILMNIKLERKEYISYISMEGLT